MNRRVSRRLANNGSDEDQQSTTMRVAWFSPRPPVRSGIAAYSAELLPLLRRSFDIDWYSESDAHDFVWKHQREPYGLTVYHLGNARCHDYMWAYLVRYPGLVVLHDARLHHARARHLLAQQRADDYRREFTFDHPDAPAAAAEYAVDGLSGSIYYFWSMLRVPVTTARLVAVHNVRVAAELAREYPDVAIETIRMGVRTSSPPENARFTIRSAWKLPADAVVFAAFGKVTAEKRVGAILDALATLRRDGFDAWLLLVGDTHEYPTLPVDLERLRISEFVRVTGYVADDEMDAFLAAADACLCLRWPTALETSASWLRCLAAGRATVISDLAHLVDVPPAVALRVDLLEEARTLADAMRRLATDSDLRGAVGRAGFEYFAAHHTIDVMAADYTRLLPHAAGRRAPIVNNLPKHFTDDHGEAARAVARQFGVAVDILE
jgi:glycosyltransferase involved in cell wall biosynthesis